MNKFLLLALAVLMPMWFIGCGKEEMPSDPEEYLPDNSSNIGEEIAKKYGLYPVGADKIKRFYLYEDNEKSKYLYGSKENEDGKEIFWFSKYDTDGQSIFDIVNDDEQFASHAYGPVQLSNGNIVVNNVLKTRGDAFEVKGSSPVVINQEGDAKFIDTKENYYYSDVLLYDDFFFTIISNDELNKVSFASNCGYQINNSGDIMRFFEGGTDELQLPSEEDNYIWLSDSAYATIGKECVSKIGISKMMSGWDFPVKLPSHNSCEMSLAVEDTFLMATYELEYSNSEKDTLVYRISESSGIGSLVSGDVDEGELVHVDVSGSIVIIDGYVTGSVRATFKNNSQKEMKVTGFKVYDTMKDAITFEHKENAIVTYEESLIYNLNLNMVFLPKFIWEYEFEGKTYTVSCGI